MKYFYLKFNTADFTKDDRTWITDTIDLYRNDQYKNYSVHKSNYGLNLLGDNTWTGLSNLGPDSYDGDPVVTTSSGFVENDRFVDTTGRIDITRHRVTTIEYPGESIDYHVNVYTTNSPDDALELWDSKDRIPMGRTIFKTNSQRYVRFEIVWDDIVNIDALEIEYMVKVEIDTPIIAPLFEHTRSVLMDFPEWTALHQDSIRAATPALATPNSLGGSLINAVAGEDLEDIRHAMTYLQLQLFLNIADLDQVAWVYIVESVPDAVYSIKGDGVELARAYDAREFYASSEEDDVCYYLDFANTIWVRKKYDVVEINDEVREAAPIHVWNWIDEHALLVDIRRLHLESNESLKKRVLDVFVNQPGTTLERLKLTLRRELNLWDVYNGATPDSYALGATPEILELEEMLRMGEYFTPDGLPTPKMVNLVDWIAERHPTTWGFFRWGNVFWDPGGKDNQGYRVLPNMFDASPNTSPVKAGVGDLDDLYLYHPEEIELIDDFEYRLRIKGLEKTTQTEYQTANFSFTIQGKSTVEYYIDRAQADVTIWVTTEDGRYWSHVNMDSGLTKSLEPIDLPRATAMIDLIDDSGNLDTSLSWGEDGAPETVFGLGLEAGALSLSLEDIVEVGIQWGNEYTYGDSSPTNAPSSGYGTLLLIEGGTPNALDANADGTIMTATNPDVEVQLVAAWDNTNPVTEEYTTPKELVDIEMNGAAPDNDLEGYDYPLPLYTFPAGSDPDTEVWELEIVSLNNDQQGAAFSSAEDGSAIEIPASNVTVNGDASWVSNKMQIAYDEELATLLFETLDVPGEYPSPYTRWETFTRTSTESFEGVVDRAGAWFEGAPPNEQAAEERLRFFSGLDRDDFGLPNTNTFIVTWMGVEMIGQSDATVYLATNTVKPIADNTNMEYPDNAIEEMYDPDTDKYFYSSFYVYGKKKERYNPEWNPYIHSGWFYTSEDEYYLYADKVTQENLEGPDIILDSRSNLGAPIMLWDSTDTQLRQVSFILNEATPIMSDTNIEIVSGNGTDGLYLSFEDVFDVKVVDLFTGREITLDESSATNVVSVSEETDFDTEYEVSYKVNKSFLVDNNYVHTDGNIHTKLTIIDNDLAGPYRVAYEGSAYNFATPADVPLNPFYTLHDESFVFVSFDEFDLSNVFVRLNPGTIASTVEDYLLVTVYSSDAYGNPKPYQDFSISTSWGTLSTGSIQTNEDGYGFAILTGEDDLFTSTAEITVTNENGFSTTATADIGLVATPNYTIAALPTADAIPADGSSIVTIYGRVLDDGALPVPYAVINYRRGNSIRDLFDKAYQGQVVADARGKFVIGPITAATPGSPGTVFYAVESWETGEAPSGPVASPNYSNPATFGPIGDIVYWREYPSILKFVNEFNELPITTEFYDSENAHFLSEINGFPVGFDEALPTLSATPNVPLDWNVPKWYHISAYKQYQLGFRGDDHYEASYYADGSHPDYKEF